MDSPWPMYCHDVRHTGRCPYTSINNTGVEAWRIGVSGGAAGGPTIDRIGTLYFGSDDLYAIYQNGTIKWRYVIGWSIEDAPAIDENGTIYFGTVQGTSVLYALYPNGTLKWTYYTGEDFVSSPAIGNDGTIYVGSNKCIHAIYPNGTRKWMFQTGHVVYSSPAIGMDGTVYCGSHDTNLYALDPTNGTLKWKFKTGDWVRVSPCIADDGTIYVVSLDGYLYALTSNGTMKWKTYVGAGTSPIIGWDGTIYCGSSNLCAINPVNGSIKWTCPLPGDLEGGTPCQANDGTIFVGVSHWPTGSIIAISPDGTIKWSTEFGGDVQSPPAIGADGSVYIGSFGEFHAFGIGPLNAHANGPYTGYYQEPLTFTSEAYGGRPPYTFHWDFGDGATVDGQNPTHNYTETGTYQAILTVTDAEDSQSSDNATITVKYRQPTVFITEPSTPGIYLMGKRILPYGVILSIGRITFKVTATEWPLGIDHVEFYVNEVLKATDYKAPYSWTWKGITKPGEYYVDAYAYDTSGQRGTCWVYIKKII